MSTISTKDSGGVMTRGTQLVVGGVLGVVCAAALVALALQVASDPTVQSNVGDELFTVGRADRLAPRVEEAGPLLFPDLLRRGRDIYVGHAGPVEDKGWFAVETRAPGAAATCGVVWQHPRRRFWDACARRSYGPTGDGLRRYPTKVIAGQVTVDLRASRQ